MKSLNELLETQNVNEKYDHVVTLPPFEYEMVLDAFRCYIKNKDYERLKSQRSYYTLKEVEDTIKMIQNSRMINL